MSLQLYLCFYFLNTLFTLILNKQLNIFADISWLPIWESQWEEKRFKQEIII